VQAFFYRLDFLAILSILYVIILCFSFCPSFQLANRCAIDSLAFLFAVALFKLSFDRPLSFSAIDALFLLLSLFLGHAL
jgi:hypothetical protein